MKLGVSVITSTKLKDRYNACKKTWINDFDNVYLFGGNIKDSNLISIESAGEDWNSHFLKQQLGLKYMYEDNPNYDWYIISSCDNILFKDRIVNELNKYDSTKDYFIGESHTYCDHGYKGHYYMSCAGGGGICLSNSYVKNIYSFIDYFNYGWTKLTNMSNYGYSDKAIALMIKLKLKIDLTHCDKMLSQDISQYDDDILKQSMILHYIKPNNMEHIYKKYKK